MVRMGMMTMNRLKVRRSQTPVPGMLNRPKKMITLRRFLLPPLDAPLILAPYSHWLARPVPDPHSASLPELIEVLIEIVNAEGPVVCRRVYSLYNKTAGYSRLGKQIVQVMNRAVYRAVKLGGLVQNDEQKRGGQINQVVRVAG